MTMKRGGIVCLVWLEWPEKCFRVDAEALRALKGFLPRGATVTRARSERAFLRALPRATHVITWHFKADWYQRAKNLRVLATPGAGRELVAWREAPKNVTVHFGGFHGAIISETVAGFVLAWAHGFFHPALRAADAADLAWRENWPRARMSEIGGCVAGTRAVIVGYGKIGKAIGAKLSALGVEVIGFGRKTFFFNNQIREYNRKSINRKIENYNPDWLILALPSDTGTDSFLNRKLLEKLPRRAVVINIGRGNAVDEAALLAALRAKRIAGAYLDVFANEPGPLGGGRIGGRRIPASEDGRLKSSLLSTLEASPPILGTPPSKLPENLVKMPHSSAFCRDYLKMCFKELKDDGLV